MVGVEVDGTNCSFRFGASDDGMPESSDCMRLHNAALQMKTAPNLENAYGLFTKAAANLFDSSAAYLFLKRKSQVAYYLAAAWPPEEFAPGFEIECDEGLMGYVFENDLDTCLVDDYRTQFPDSRQDRVFSSVMSAAIRGKVDSDGRGAVIGGITIANAPGCACFQEHDLLLLQAFVDFLSVSIDSARCRERLVKYREDSERRDRRMAQLLAGAQGDLYDRMMELRALAKRSSDAVEVERARISQSLHDGVKQSIAGTMHTVEAALASLDDDLETAKKHLQMSLQFLKQIDSDVQSVILDLRPQQLDSRGLVACVKRYCEATFGLTEIDCDYRCHGDIVPLPRNKEEALYFIAAEAVQNIALHSNARRAFVHFNYTDKAVRLSVEDDGKGFDATARFLGVDGGLGIPGMKERARSAGGDVSIESEPGKGTVVNACVPIRGDLVDTEDRRRAGR